VIRLGPADDETFVALAGGCGAPTWCSRSCEELGEHVLIVPESPHETYDQIVARARFDLPELLAAART
jgi:hypothetical protein